MSQKPKIGWSEFCRSQNEKIFSQDGLPGMFLSSVIDGWDKRVPGAGRCDLEKVVIVELDPRLLKYFRAKWIPIGEATALFSTVTRRWEGEDPYILTVGNGPALPNKTLKAVLYSNDTLLENNGHATGKCEWEVVALIASPFENEPMPPLTMARNYLEKVGGTFAPYSAKQLAESIYFWSQYVQSAS